ncbi:MAG TPA: AmpG family muropeptide MFS transporter [Gammaproteobacteria bacterium]
MTGTLRAWLAASAVYRDRRVLAVGFLGFSSGLPLALTFGTLTLWLAELGIDKTTIGLFALAGTPYTLKFLWAPLVDRVPLPWLTRRFGRRRGWMLATQVALMAGITLLGGSDPVAAPTLTALLALLVAFCSATQDIAIDAYRVEILDERRYGAGAALVVLGYRIGMLASGAGALYAASFSDWGTAYAIMAALMAVGVVTVLLNPEPAVADSPEARAQAARVAAFVAARPDLRGRAGRALAWLHGAVVAPFAEFLARPGWLAVLGFVVLYKFGDALAGVMSGPFYVELGFSKIEIANVTKAFGLGATIAGGLLGGLLVSRHGIWRSLWACGLLQMLSNLMFVVQALAGHDLALLTLTIGLENLAGGMGTAAFVAYLSSLCNVAYTATQYALLSSLAAFGRTLLSSSGGWLAVQLDWVGFFLLTTVAALPGLVLLWWLGRHFRPTR